MAEIAAAGAALANGAGSLFSYNKDVFVFDNTLRQQKVHQIQNIRLQQVGLYREDLRDLFGLTISKMDNYLVVNTLMLGFCIALFYDGVLPDNNPPWLWWMWCLDLSGATIFLLISVWLSLHASITAQSMVVKLLTQWLRLPLPRTEDIAAASATVEDYECCPVSSILRIPGLQRFDPRRKKADMDAFSKVDKDGRVSGEGDQLYHIHFKLFEHVQKSWQGYDAYARVCMAVGTNQLLLTLCVFAMGVCAVGNHTILVSNAILRNLNDFWTKSHGLTLYLASLTSFYELDEQLFFHSSSRMMLLFSSSTLIGDRQPWAAWVFIIVVATGAMLHFRINLTLSKLELIVMVSLIYAAPLTAAVAATLDYAGWLIAGRVWALISFIINDLWICFVFAQAMESRGGLPEKFNTVDISSDVMSDNSMQHFVQDELRDLGIDAKNPGDFLWGSSDLTKGSSPDEELLGKCEEEENELEKVFADDSKLPRMPKGRLAALKSDFQKIRNEFDLAKRAEPGSNNDICDDTSSMETSSEQDWVKLARDCSANGSEGTRADYYVNSVTGDIRWRPALRRSMSDTLSSTSTRGLSSSSGSAAEADRLEHEVRDFKKSVEKLEVGSMGPEDRSDSSTKCSSESSSSSSSSSAPSTTSSSSCKDSSHHHHHQRAPMDFQHYSLRPWSIYKQASTVVVVAWTVGIIWCVLDLLNIPTGTDIRASVEGTAPVVNTPGPFFVPVGMTSRNSLSDSLIIADAVGLWPRVGDGIELNQDISDVEYLNNSIAIACGEDKLIDYKNGLEIKMPVNVEKMANLAERSMAVSTPDNYLYLLYLDNDGVWHRQAKIGDYNNESDKITGIAHSEKYGLLVLTNNGDIHIWDMSNGVRKITHLNVPDIKRYTAITTTSGEDNGIMVSAIKNNHQAVQVEAQIR